MKRFEQFFNYWGKAEKAEEGQPLRYHLLPYHCLDVAAVGKVLLARHRSLFDFFAKHSGLEGKTFTALTLYFLALHDLGKFSESFQGLREDLLSLLNQRKKTKVYDEIRHDSLGYFLWFDQLNESFCKKRLMGHEKYQEEPGYWCDFFNIWALAFMGHHGQPPKGCDRPVSRYFVPDNIAAAKEFLQFCEEKFLPEISLVPPCPIEEWVERMKCLSWWLAGFVVLCDWLGSNDDFFLYNQTQMSLDDYWLHVALPSAEKAVRSTDFLPAPVATQTGLSNLFEYVGHATPLQKLAETIPLAKGPHIFILEDVTGAGKTEAAFMLLHRLMTCGGAEGAYVALPTMATANAMYDRTRKVYRKLYAEDSMPSLVLAHGARHLVDGFIDSVIPVNTPSDTVYDRNESTASVYCNAWLADNRKKALLAHMGVGTIDQALLAVLRSRHQSMRLLGLRNKVLIVDEVHASDAYMHRLLQDLLTFHAAAGGSVILLSATLPYKMRQELLNAYSNGLGKHGPELTNDGYPLLTMLNRDDFQEKEVATRPEVKRDLAFLSLQTEQEAIELIIEKANGGNCVAWVRNTVADALETYQRLIGIIPEERVVLFHARFALGDRLEIEEKVLSLFGKKSSAEQRAGKILIATQVIEQSLDLDFDWLVSDLAPIDLLIQRAGRLRRHTRDKSGNPIDGDDQRGQPKFYILTPDPHLEAGSGWFGELFPKAVKIYEDHGRLWLTARYLREKKEIKIPEEMRGSMEHIYGEQSEDHIPAGLLSRSLDAETDSMVQRSQARMNSIDFADGYSMPDHEWWDETITPTRLGEPTVTLRLAKWEHGELRPWSDAPKNAWSLSEVSVRQRMAASEATPDDPLLARAIDNIKSQWPGRQQAFCLLVPIVKTDSGVCVGNVIDEANNKKIVHYSNKFGLWFVK
ncbi:MAG: CRISPR-associated helicase Cas3' [Devosiaceae bacterium]|nr:CRISPR-associated helicase Cas3' [Devosiaceae bacterium]